MRQCHREPGHVHLARLRDKGDLNALGGYLKDPESSRRLRTHAATYIASTKPGGGKATTATGAVDSAIIPILAPVLENDPDPSVRRAAAYGLRRAGEPSAVQPLLHALTDEDKATRIHAAMGLGNLHAREAVVPLSRLLQERSCAAPAARALVEIGDERALSFLRSAALSTRSRRRRRKLALAVIELERRVGLQPGE